MKKARNAILKFKCADQRVGIIIVATIRIYSSNWTGGQDIASMEEKILLPHVTRVQFHQLLANKTHVAHVQQPLVANTNHDNLNDNTQQIQFAKEINLLKHDIMGRIDDFKMKMGVTIIDQQSTSHKTDAEDEGNELLLPHQHQDSSESDTELITTLSNTLHETVINEPQTQQGVRDKVNTKDGINVNVAEGINFNCGNHRASTCAECGNNASWCNGECEWSDEQGGICQSKPTTKALTKVNCGDHNADTCFQCTKEVSNKCGGDCYWWLSSSGGVCMPYEYHSVSKSLTQDQKTVASSISPCLRESLSHPVTDRYSSLDRQGDYPDLASSRMLHDLFSERVHSYLGYLNRSEAFEAIQDLSLEEKCVRSPVPKVSQVISEIFVRIPLVHFRQH